MKHLTMIIAILSLANCKPKMTAENFKPAIYHKLGKNLHMACNNGKCAICKSSKPDAQAFFECASNVY